MVYKATELRRNIYRVLDRVLETGEAVEIERNGRLLRGGSWTFACVHSFTAVVQGAMELQWTHDPFDRLITAQAALGNSELLTRDRLIRAHYPHARW